MRVGESYLNTYGKEILNLTGENQNIYGAVYKNKEESSYGILQPPKRSIYRV